MMLWYTHNDCIFNIPEYRIKVLKSYNIYISTFREFSDIFDQAIQIRIY